MPHVWNGTAGEIGIEILEMLLKIRQRLALSCIVRKLFEIPNPLPAVLPIHIFFAFHIGQYSRAVVDSHEKRRAIGPPHPTSRWGTLGRRDFANVYLALALVEFNNTVL